MWPWLLLSVLALAVAGVAVARNRLVRPRGLTILSAAVAAVIAIEAMIRLDVVSVGVGTELMSLVTILIIAVSLATLPRAGRSQP